MNAVAPPPVSRPLPPSADGPRFDPSLHRHARLTAGAAFLLIAAGGLVTSTLSALSVPDWPLSYGTLFPRMTGGVRFEHSHRLIAGAVALATFALAWRTWRRDPRPWARKLGLAAAGGILAQALLGGMTVLLKLPPPVSIAHACLGQTVFCLLLACAQCGSRWYMEEARPGRAPGLWRWGAAACAAVFLQLLLGARLRHTGLGTMAHMAWAAGVVVSFAVLTGKVFLKHVQEPALVRPAVLLSLLVPTQLLLGVASLLVRQSPSLQVGFYQGAMVTASHQTLGALILGTALTLTLRARRLA